MTLDDLTTPLTRDEVIQAIYSALAANGVSTTGWKPGAVVRTIITGLAIVVSALSQLQALIAKSGFLQLAEGDWLTLVARFVYGVERDQGSFATGTVTLTNSGGGLFGVGIGDLIVAHATTHKTYRNTAAFTLHASETLIVPIQADELGSGSNANPNTITAFVTTMLGVSVTNANSLAGNDAEDDPTLRIRCGEKTGTLSPNGPRDAYAFFARSAKRADGSSIGVTRVRTIADGLGNVNVYVATKTGAVPGLVGDLSTDLGVVDEQIQTKVVPLAITAIVASATPLSINVTWELWLRDNTGNTDSDIIDAVNAALTSFFATQPIGGNVIAPAGGKIYVSAIEAVVGGVFPAATLEVSITIPASDVSVGASQVPIFGTPSSTVHQIAGDIL